MNPDLMSNLLIQVPALGVVVYLVIHFLAYLKVSRVEDRIFITNLVRDQSETIERGSKVIEKNSNVINENTKVMAETRYIIANHNSKNVSPDES